MPVAHRDLRRPSYQLRIGVALFLMVAPIVGWSADKPDGLAAARALLLTGKYAEAEEAFTGQIAQEPAAVIGLAEVQSLTGRRAAAEKTLAAGIAQHPKSAALPGRFAQLAFDRGDYPEAQRQAEAALKADENELTARWVVAELHRVQGRVADADKAYHFFVDFYNAHDEFKSPSDVQVIGWGAAQFARWNRLHDQYSFLVNDLYPSCRKLERKFWPGHLEAGKLFLEKYNQAEASREFKAALAINPNAAEVHVALAELALQNYDLAEAQAALDRALKINPEFVAAQQAQAQLHLANFAAQAAIESLTAARKLNPVQETTLGLLGAAYAGVDGVGDAPESRLGKLIAEVEKRNPHAGEFYLALATGLDALRKFPAAAKYYRLAVEKLPQLMASRGQLGLMLMRLGAEGEAEKLLKASFDIDPFNVRVNNTLKVLDVLAGYATLETEHFIIKFDRGQDEVLAKCVARFLEEEVYPDLTKRLGYRPADKSLFEIFNKAKNTNGHGWFSARMVGLPYIGTVGACAGKMVALSSPNDGPKYNWARVVKHEFTHVLNLQQTDFNIPHWFTEALAVHHEGYPPPREWQTLLADRFAADKLFTLDTINLGFIRPHSSQEWTLAYCQAELYAAYLLEKYGDAALAKMLQAYADNLTTTAALKREFQVDVGDFERGYKAFLEKRLAGSRTPVKPALSFAELEAGNHERPEDVDVAAQLALEYVRRKSYPEARKLADAVLKKEPKNQLAAYVKARIRLLTGETDEALALLEGALDKARPQENLVGLLAGLKLQAKDYSAAAELYELAAQSQPNEVQWTQSLAKTYLLAKDDKRLRPVLEKLAQADADDGLVRKKLAQMCLDAKDHGSARRWAQQAVYCNVLDGEAHRLLATAAQAAGEWGLALESYELAVRLLPADSDLRYTWAEACAAAGKRDLALTVLEKLLSQKPEHEQGKALRKRLEAGR